MAGKKFQAPDLSNATPTMLVDEMAKLSLIENYAKALRKFYREALYARVGYKVEDFANGETRDYSGEKFTATTTRSDPERLSSTLVKERYPEVAAECSVSAGQLTTRFSLNGGVTNPIVSDLLALMKKELDLD